MKYTQIILLNRNSVANAGYQVCKTASGCDAACHLKSH